MLNTKFLKCVFILVVATSFSCKKMKETEEETTVESKAAGGKSDTSGEYVGRGGGDELESLSLICDPVSGSPKDHQGTGACAGNVAIRLPLDAVYGDLALTYNSSWNANRSGFGINITLSDMAYIQFGEEGSSWLQLGDGSFIDIVRSTDAALKGAWVARNRSESTATIEKVDANRIVQREAGGSEYYYTKVDAKRFALDKVTNRFNESMLLKVDGSGKDEYLLYSDGTRITIVRTGSIVTLAREDRKATATLQLDSANRLSKVTVLSEEGKNTLVYSLTYTGKTPLLARYEVLFNDESLGWGSYTYDSLSRLMLQLNSDESGSLIVRDDKNRTVASTDQSGFLTVETFNELGQLVKTMKFLNEKRDVVLLEATYVYNAAGEVLSVTYPKAKFEYSYDAKKPHLMTGSKEYLEGKLIKTTTSTWDVEKELPLKSVTLGPNGETIASTETKWQSTWPYLMLESVDSTIGEKRTYTYAGDQTVMQTYIRAVKPDGTIEWMPSSVQELDKRDIVKLRNELAPQNQKDMQMTYNDKGQVASITQDSKTSTIEYDSEGRVTAIRSAESVIEKTYDSKGFLTQEKTSFLKTGKQKLTEYSRSLDSEGVLQTVSSVTTHPSGAVDNTQYVFEDGEIKTITLNGVKIYG